METQEEKQLFATDKLRFRVIALYSPGTINREATIDAESPAMAALLAVWKALVPLEYVGSFYGAPEPTYWAPERYAKAKHQWPEPVSATVLQDGSTEVFVGWGCTENRYLLRLRVTGFLPETEETWGLTCEM